MIHLLPDSEQVQVVDAIAALMKSQGALTTHKPEAVWPADAHQPTHAALAEFGLFGLALPEEAGGIGYGAAEEVLSFTEIGRALGSPSCAATSLAARILQGVGQEELRDTLVAGETRAAFAVAAPGSLYLIDAQGADWILLASSEGLALHPADAVTTGDPVTSFDPTLSVTTGDIAGEPVARADDATLTASHIILAAMAVGTSEAALVMATEYAKTREQFGQPIGAFQAVKHHCSDMAVAAHCGATQVALAAVSFDAGAPDTAFLGHAALHTALDGAISNGRTNIQVHGGIGFTAEHAAHLYLKRAHLLAHIAGGTTAHLEASLNEGIS